MGSPGRRAAFAGLLLAILALGGRAAADGGNRATSTDAVAKELVDEYEELQKKKETIRGTNRRLEILRELGHAACVTTHRFLLALLKRSSAPGDERLYALLSLATTADAGTLEAVLAALAREKDPTLWEAFGDAVGDSPSDDVRAWLAGPGLTAPTPEAVCACLDGLARRPDPKLQSKIAELYAKHAASPAGVDVAYRALQTLVRTAGAGARDTLLEAARSPEWRIRLAAAEALPALEPFDADVEATVRGLLQDAEAPVRQTAAERTGLAKRESLAGALIGLLGDPRVRTRHVASVALETLSGQKLGHDPKAWAAWLEKRDPGNPEQVTFPTYHGFSVRSDRVVFLVDASSSMLWPWRKPVHRIDVARAELASVLRQLTPDTMFNVLVFADKVASWKKAEVVASPENVGAAVRWAEKAMAEPAGDTHLYEALQTAFANDPQFDTIYLLTDGNPMNGAYWTSEGLLASVKAWTRYRRTAIQAIGLSLASEDLGMPNMTEDLFVMAKLLGALAAATSGEFREIRNAPPAK